jgi:hypothetical protein
MRSLWAVVLALGLAACASYAPGHALYQWSDAEGNVRYTVDPESVPRDLRDTLTRVEPGRSADENAALSPGARTQPRPGQTAADWLRGGAQAPAAGAASAAGPQAQAAAAAPSAPPTPEEIASLDARIAELQRQITEAELALTENLGEAQQAEGLRAASETLPKLQAELRALEARRAQAKPADEP